MNSVDMNSVVMSTEKWKELSGWMTKQSIETLNEFPIKPYEVYDYKTAEDLENIVKPMIEVGEINMNNKDFALVHGYFRGTDDADGEMVLVPTKEECNDFKQRIDNRFDMLSKRIEALENERAK